MTRIVITAKDTKATLEEKLKKVDATKGKKPFDAKKYAGKIKGCGDPMVFQKTLRNEWD